MDKTIIVALIAAVGTSIVTPVVKYFIDRLTRKEERMNKKEDNLTDWQKSVDTRINQVISKMNSLEVELSACKELSKRSLKGNLLTGQHLAEGNHIDLIKDYVRETEDYLIEDK